MQKKSSKSKSVKVVATENDFNSKEVSEPGMFSYSQPFFSQVREALLNRGSQSALRMWEIVGQHFKLPPCILENSLQVKGDPQQMLFELLTQDPISDMVLRYAMPLISTGYYPIDIAFARMPPFGFELNVCGSVRIISTFGSKFLVTLTKCHNSNSATMTIYLLK